MEHPSWLAIIKSVPPHVFLAAAIAFLGGRIAAVLRFNLRIFFLIALVAAAAFAARREIGDVLDGSDTAFKALTDFASILAGFAAGLLLARRPWPGTSRGIRIVLLRRGRKLGTRGGQAN